MALLDRRLKQRMVGALVLLALAAVFLPMLFNRADQPRAVPVEAPPMPAAPAPLQIETPAPGGPAARAAVAPSGRSGPVAAPASRPDGAGRPLSWSVQLVSLSNAARAQEL